MEVYQYTGISQTKNQRTKLSRGNGAEQRLGQSVQEGRREKYNCTGSTFDGPNLPSDRKIAQVAMNLYTFLFDEGLDILLGPSVDINFSPSTKRIWNAVAQKFMLPDLLGRNTIR